ENHLVENVALTGKVLVERPLGGFRQSRDIERRRCVITAGEKDVARRGENRRPSRRRRARLIGQIALSSVPMGSIRRRPMLWFHTVPSQSRRASRGPHVACMDFLPSPEDRAYGARR